ncbi:MAG: DUF937 domain-containing protein [Thermomonas sp.]
MTSLTQGLAAQLAGAPVRDIAQQLGVSPSQAQGAIASALPLLIGALGNNASQPQGAQALFGALQDHSGSGGDIAGVLGSVLGGAMGGAGGSQDDSLGRMLGHIFGGQQQQATQGLGQATGLGSDKTQMLLRILAPIVMAYLANHMFGGQQQQQVATQDSNPQGLGDILGREVEQIGQQQQGGGLGDLLGQVLGGGNAGGLGGLLGGILGGGQRS